MDIDEFLKTISSADRALVVEYTNHMRDADVARNASKHTEPKAVVLARLEKPIRASGKTLSKLCQSDSAIRIFAEDAMAGNEDAVEKLRQLGRRIKLDLASASTENEYPPNVADATR